MPIKVLMLVAGMVLLGYGIAEHQSFAALMGLLVAFNGLFGRG